MMFAGNSTPPAFCLPHNGYVSSKLIRTVGGWAGLGWVGLGGESGQVQAAPQISPVRGCEISFARADNSSTWIKDISRNDAAGFCRIYETRSI